MNIEIKNKEIVSKKRNKIVDVEVNDNSTYVTLMVKGKVLPPLKLDNYVVTDCELTVRNDGLQSYRMDNNNYPGMIFIGNNYYSIEFKDRIGLNVDIKIRPDKYGYTFVDVSYYAYEKYTLINKPNSDKWVR